MKGAGDYSSFRKDFSRKGAKDAKAQRQVKCFGRVPDFDPPLRLCVLCVFA